MKTIHVILLFLFFVSCGYAYEAPDDAEPLAILELGAAPSRSLTGEGWSVGPTMAVEFTPIEKWLEIEVGVTATPRRHRTTEWSADLLFKKPWSLSDKVEFMIGAGPEWLHNQKSNAIGGAAVLDFMFWTSAKRRFGWYVEPSYEYSFGRGHERSLGVSAGLLIAIPRRH